MSYIYLRADFDDEIIKDLCEMEILDLPSLRSFIRGCITVVGIGFHPDTDFGEYVTSNKELLFTDKEAADLDDQIVTAFKLADELKVDIYKICLFYVNHIIRDKGLK
jgi:hypothetical protein